MAPLPRVVLAPGDFEVIFRHGRLSSIELLDRGMAKLIAAGYTRTQQIDLEVQQSVVDNQVVAVVVRPDGGKES